MSRGRVLIVEDDEFWREKIFKRKLETKGYEVLTADRYEAVIQHLYAGAFDVAVVDIGLSQKDYQNTDGMKVLAAIAELDPDIPAIVVSGRAAEGMKKEDPAFHRTVAFLEKETFSASDFLAEVERALRLGSAQAEA